MMSTLWETFHAIGFHFYTLPACALLLIAAIVGTLYWVNERNRDKDHEERLEEIYENTLQETGGRR